VHLSLFHQEFDDIDRTFRHAVGEFLDGDGLRQLDFANDLFSSVRAFREPVSSGARVGRRSEASERSRWLSSKALVIVSRWRPRRSSSTFFDGRALDAFGLL